MADTSVFIAGIQEGALGSAADWAKEITQKEILTTLKKILEKSGGGSISTSADSVENFVKAIEDFIEQSKKAREGQKEEEKNRSILNRNLKQELVYQFQQYYWGAKLYETMVQNVSTFNQLNESGINVMAGFDNAATGFKAVQQLAVLTGVRFTELSQTLVKYNTAVNVFGLGRFAKTLGNTSRELTQFGFSTKDAAELLGAYLETQRQFADVNSRTQDEVQKDLVSFGKRVDQLSKTTGVARQALLDQIKTIASTVEAQILSNQIGADGTQATLEFISSFRDKKVGNEILRLMTDVIKPLNVTFQNFQKLGMGGFAQKFQAFTQSLQGLDPIEAQRRTAEFVRANRGQIIAMQQQANLYRQTNLAGEAESSLSTLRGLIEQERLYAEVKEEDRLRTQRAAEASKKLTNAYEKLMAQLQIFFAPLASVLNLLTMGLEFATRALDKFRELVNGAGEKIFGQTLSELGGEITDVVGMFGILTVAGLAVLGTFKGLSALGGLIGGLMGRLGGLVGKLFNKGGSTTVGPAAAAGGPTGSAAGGFLQRILSGGVGGLLEGLARGLGAFANPAIVPGAVNFSLALGAISLAIAGSGYVIGLALPTLAEGFMKLSEVDGNKLGDSAMGMAKMALGLLPFATMAVWAIPAGIGLNYMADGLSKLASVDADRLARVADAMQKIREATPTITESLKSGIAGVIARISTPASATVETAAERSAAAGSRPAGSGTSSANNTEINTMLTLNNQLLEEIRTGMTNLISINQDILKYTKAKA